MVRFGYGKETIILTTEQTGNKVTIVCLEQMNLCWPVDATAEDTEYQTSHAKAGCLHLQISHQCNASKWITMHRSLFGLP